MKQPLLQNPYRQWWSIKLQDFRENSLVDMDMGDHFRIICADIDLVKQSKPMPNLPVAMIMYRHKPKFEIGTAAWCYAGGAHHFVVSTALNRSDIIMFAKLIGTEFVAIGDETTEADLQRW